MIRVAQPQESKLDRMQRKIRQERDSDTTLGQDCVAPALYHIPLRGCECQSERAPALRENAFFDFVLDRTERDTVSIVRRSERMKEVEGGRRPIKGRRGTVQSRKR